MLGCIKRKSGEIEEACTARPELSNGKKTDKKANEEKTREPLNKKGSTGCVASLKSKMSTQRRGSLSEHQKTARVAPRLRDNPSASPWGSVLCALPAIGGSAHSA